MNRNLIAALAVSGALAACAQRPATTSTPATTPQTSVATGGGMQGMGGMGGDQQGRGDRGARMQQMLFAGITLTADQQAQIDSIRARHQNDRQGLDPRNNPSDRDTMRQRMQAQMSEIRAVLTPDQQTIFDKNVADMRSRMGGMGSGQGNGGGNPPA